MALQHPSSNGNDELHTETIQAALDAAGIGTWEYHPARSLLRLSGPFQKLLPLGRAEISLSELIGAIDPRDQNAVFDAFMNAMEPGSDGTLEVEFRKSGTDLVWLQLKGRANFEGGKRLSRFSGVIQDISSLTARERHLRMLIEQAPVATALYVGRGLRIELANDVMISYWGKDRSVIGQELGQAVPELKGQPFLSILDEVYTQGITRQYSSTPAQLLLDGKLDTFYFDFTYKPLFDDAGNVFAIMHMAVDVTQRVLAAKALESSEANLRAVISSAPAAIGLFVGRDLIVQMPNQAFIDIVGKGPDITGKPLREVMPELDSQPFLQILDDVFTSGKMFQSFGSQVNIVQHGVMSHNFYNITYTPLFDAEGQVYAILDIAIDVTEKVLEQQQVEKSQLELLALFEESPVGIAILSAGDLMFTMANPFYGELVGRKPEEILGKKLLDALPEIEGQGFDLLLHQVVETGIPFIKKEVSVNLWRNNKLETIYVDLSYLPRKAPDHSIYGILVVATDVTQQVISRSAIEQAESDLRGAIELAELGTWRLDAQTQSMLCSQRLLEWLGHDTGAPLLFEDFLESVAPAMRYALRSQISNALTAGIDAKIQTEFSTDPSRMRQVRTLAMQGIVHATEPGVYFVTGTVQDITSQREYQASLERLVQLRTEELEAASEEMAATNEELTEANEQLMRSNDSLQQFSYVASHDLQEPLRKIQAFGDLLETRYGANLGEGGSYLKRMQASARRMTFLIEDLLSFSRVSYKEITKQPVSLNKVIELVLTDLELAIRDANATVTTESLPMIEGDQSQLVQLFTNLVSNAIKFRRPDVSPVVTISCEVGQLDAGTRGRSNPLEIVRISVSDNGIGFDPTYIDRIFQVFQRLHGRSEFPGTGIGLAICEKVVTNHGGSITATSTPGVGSTFSVSLPL